MRIRLPASAQTAAIPATTVEYEVVVRPAVELRRWKAVQEEKDAMLMASNGLSTVWLPAYQIHGQSPSPHHPDPKHRCTPVALLPQLPNLVHFVSMTFYSISPSTFLTLTPCIGGTLRTNCRVLSKTYPCSHSHVFLPPIVGPKIHLLQLNLLPCPYNGHLPCTASLLRPITRIPSIDAPPSPFYPTSPTWSTSSP